MNSVEMRQKRGKSNQKIRHFHYFLWVQELLRKEISPTNAQYGFPESALAFIRDIVPDMDCLYKVNLLVFCEIFGIQKI